MLRISYILLISLWMVFSFLTIILSIDVLLDLRWFFTMLASLTDLSPIAVQKELTLQLWFGSFWVFLLWFLLLEYNHKSAWYRYLAATAILVPIFNLIYPFIRLRRLLSAAGPDAPSNLLLWTTPISSGIALILASWPILANLNPESTGYYTFVSGIFLDYFYVAISLSMWRSRRAFA